MIDYKEYTRLRDIAQKRIKRGQEAGYGIDVHIPTVKELRQRGEYAGEIELLRLQQFIKTGFSLERRRAASRPRLTEEERKERRREQSRQYRRRKVAREEAREEYPTKYLEYLKGIETLNRKIREQYKDNPAKMKRNLIDIKPKDLPAFFAYMDYRFSQGSSRDKKYVFDIFLDDFQEILKKGYNPEQTLSDFKKFEADQLVLAERAGNMEGMNYERAAGLWEEYIGTLKKEV